MKTAALYARYSTDKQDARSIDDQFRRCRAFAQARSLSVVAVHQDAAISGASIARPGLRKLLLEAKRKDFDAVIVDDLSRLSRDLGQAWQMIFGDLASVGVRVIDATTGMASDGAGARLTFGALALVNDTFLQLVRTETHRGLEGRALAGFWAGGSCYGFTTKPEESPQDPERPRAEPVLVPEEAAIVREIFERYARGESQLQILDWIGERPAPADGATKKKMRGWSKSLLYSMVRNERYAGIFIWNKRQWLKDPTTGKRRYIERPESEWVRHERPELAIVDRATWERVQARNAATSKASGGARQRSASRYLLSGLLRCGVCSGALSIVARRKKGEAIYNRFGCSMRASRGPSACANKETLSELALNVEVIRALRAHLASPCVEQWVSDVAAAHEAETEVPDVAADVAKAKKRVENVLEALARIGFSETLQRKLQAEEEKLRTLRAQLVKSAPAKKSKVSVAQILERLGDLEGLAAKRPEEARAALSAIVEAVILKPHTDGRMRGTLRLKSETATLASGRPIAKVQSCGDRI